MSLLINPTPMTPNLCPIHQIPLIEQPINNPVYGSDGVSEYCPKCKKEKTFNYDIIEKEFASNIPYYKALFQIAWTYGHTAGKSEVKQILDDLTYLIRHIQNDRCSDCGIVRINKQTK